MAKGINDFMLKYYQQANISDEIARGITKVISQERTQFQECLFFESEIHGCCISLDADIQSCEADEGLYHEALVHPAMMLHENPKTVLIMGGGEGATAREVLRHPTVETAVMVDIDEEFVVLCRKHIPNWSRGVWEDPRLEVRYQDINEYIHECDKKFDVVVGDLVDVHDWNSQEASLYGLEFYNKLKAALNPGAIVVTQAGALGGASVKDHNRIRNTMSRVFKNRLSYALVVPSFYHLWGFIIASDRDNCESSDGVVEQFSSIATARNLDLPMTGPEALSAAFSLPRLVSREMV